jgi:hypothetical protein
MGTGHQEVPHLCEAVPGVEKQWEQYQELPDGAKHRVQEKPKGQREPPLVLQRKEPIGVFVDISERITIFSRQRS